MSPRAPAPRPSPRLRRSSRPRRRARSPARRRRWRLVGQCRVSLRGLDPAGQHHDQRARPGAGRNRRGQGRQGRCRIRPSTPTPTPRATPPRRQRSAGAAPSTGAQSSTDLSAKAEKSRRIWKASFSALPSRCEPACHVHIGPDRQSRRDCLSRRPHRAADGDAHHRGLFRGGRQRAARPPCDEAYPHRAGAGARKLSRDRCADRGRAQEPRASASIRATAFCRKSRTSPRPARTPA